MIRIKRLTLAALAALVLAAGALAAPAPWAEHMARKGSFDLTINQPGQDAPAVAGSKGAETFGRESS